MYGIKFINEIITIPQTDINKCREHAEKFSTSRTYKDSFQTNTDKIKQDAFLGKLSEFAVYHRLTQQGFDCSEPDLEIYESKQRSWDYDLTVKIHKNMYNLSIKSCDTLSNSWVFQADFSGRYDKSIFDYNKNHIICLTQVLEDSQALVYAFITTSKALELMRLPRLRRLFGKKLCIYKQDINYTL